MEEHFYFLGNIQPWIEYLTHGTNVFLSNDGDITKIEDILRGRLNSYSKDMRIVYRFFNNDDRLRIEDFYYDDIQEYKKICKDEEILIGLSRLKMTNEYICMDYCNFNLIWKSYKSSLLM